MLASPTKTNIYYLLENDSDANSAGVPVADAVGVGVEFVEDFEFESAERCAEEMAEEIARVAKEVGEVVGLDEEAEDEVITAPFTIDTPLPAMQQIAASWPLPQQ
ncbi:hypothetical protein CORC01_06094 [Colletotrichum orchidophilum]|uniref:Uncharacterized protein n=1 Tax=Colletotrichum orchidophilum TaxID=1209926 RepID=A0A1G4BB66_9PEZI|nr:uncharacterized protein CORC01_06094 [Colletotrichum orchidophilum]OHE98643.1 hypothetical protein CORC01_06094 [Colletotrichum orchidophilum]